LKAAEDQRRCGLRRFRRALQSFLARLAVLVKQLRQREFGIVRRQPGDRHFDDFADRKAAFQFPQIVLQTTDHHRLELLDGLDRDAAAESLRIQNLEQRRETVRVAVMWRRRQKQAVLEKRRQLSDRLREL